MKSIAQLRKEVQMPHTSVQTENVDSLTNPYYFIDYEVWLPSLGRNLQRDFIWTEEQKKELIMSIFYDRPIPPIVVLSTIADAPNGAKRNWQIIDGKQRLSTILNYFQDIFSIEIDGKNYFFSELPEDYKTAITRHRILVAIHSESYDRPITDQQKDDWYNLLNYSGTAHVK